MSHMPPVRPDDASPIPDPVRSRPAGAVPKRSNGPAAHSPRVETGNGSGRSSGGGLGLAALAAGAAALVAGVAAARRLGRDTPPLYRSLRATPKEWWWSGFKVTYYETGPRRAEPIAEADVETEAAEPIVLVHSIHAAASAWEMRELFERFDVDRRVIALDLLGFGASERPDVDYDSDLYQDLLRDFLAEVVGESAHVLANGLSAAHALQAAASAPANFKSLILVNPSGLLSQATGPDGRGRLVQNLFRLPFLGEALYNLLVSRPSLRYYDAQVYRDPGVAEANAEHHYATAHQPGARYAPAAFLGDALGRNVYMALRTVEVPALSLWTDSHCADTEREAEAFKAVAPGMQQIRVEGSGALPYEEKPDVVAGYIRGWLRKHE
jgi:pimeloyl-ACP methyl ester carboxylesterase